MNLTDNHAWLWVAGKNMTFSSKRVFALSALAVLAAVGSFSLPAFAAEEDGVALAIVYDTSGSMRETVPDQHGNPAPKYVIANRALIAIAKQIQAFATNNATGAPRRIDAALFTFENNGARQAIKFGPFHDTRSEERR